MSIGLQIYTIIHVVLSLAGIGSGFAVFYGLLTDKRQEDTRLRPPVGPDTRFGKFRLNQE